MKKISVAGALLLSLFTAAHAADSTSSKLKEVAARTAAWEGKVMTVCGLIPAGEMGITLPHEHLLIIHDSDKVNLRDERVAGDELQLFVNAGGKTLVEMTNYGIGRNPAALKRIAERTGAHVIMGCGYYKDRWLSFDMRAKPEQEIADDIIHDIVDGVDGIHAGVIGEMGVSRPMTAFEEKQLRAAAVAQKATGAAINVHFDIPDDLTARNRGVDIIEKAGGDLSRVVISHFRPNMASVDMCVAIAKRGCYVEFDLFGQEVIRASQRKDTEEAAVLKALIDRGCLDRILVSQDICFSTLYTKNRGHGYAHLLKNVVPKLKAAGITDEQIRTIMVENPKRLLAFVNYGT